MLKHCMYRCARTNNKINKLTGGNTIKVTRGDSNHKEPFLTSRLFLYWTDWQYQCQSREPNQSSVVCYDASLTSEEFCAAINDRVTTSNNSARCQYPWWHHSPCSVLVTVNRLEGIYTCNLQLSIDWFVILANLHT